jgi:uncharacterized protein YndB with AHSA1/START domain
MSRFVYVTYIRTTPAKLWQALTDPAFTERYWFGARQECDWKVGSPWKLVLPTIGLADSGEVLEVQPEKRLVLSWRNEFMPELKAEGFSRMTYDIESDGEAVKLTVTHESDGEKFISAVSGGWPKILSSLKSLLETGQPLPRPG